MKRMHRVLNSFSRGSKIARLNQLMFRNLKSGKNSGKVVGHLKKEPKNI
jgi:hypothetical protein